MARLIFDEEELVVALVAALQSPAVRDELTKIINTVVPTSQSHQAVSVPIAAQQLGISRAKMWALVKAGHIKTVHIGRSTRVPMREVDRLANEGIPVAANDNAIAEDPRAFAKRMLRKKQAG